MVSPLLTLVLVLLTWAGALGDVITWDAEHMLWIGVMRSCGAKGSDGQIRGLLMTSFADCAKGKLCMFGQWGAWGACDRTCGVASQQVRTRNMRHCATPFSESRRCNVVSCTADCVWRWGQWSACDQSCGGGHRERKRTIVQHARAEGKVCPRLETQRQRCNNFDCPADCVYQPWVKAPCKSCKKSWKKCRVVHCGSANGTQQLTRGVKRRPSYGGKACAHRTKFASCGRAPCKVDCIVTPWVVLPCDAACAPGARNAWAAGFRTRKRTVKQAPKFGGKACGALEDKIKCRLSCAGDCAMALWSTWSACPRTCTAPGDELRPHAYAMRHRAVARHPIDGGKSCPASRIQKRVCNTVTCPSDCSFSPWGAWSFCSTTCGAGHRRSSHMISKKANHGGRACPTQLARYEACNEHLPCAASTRVAAKVRCTPHFAPWGAWGRCSKSCGMGQRIRKRVQTLCVGDTTQRADHLSYEYCRATFCRKPVNAHTAAICTTTLWGSWSDCDKAPCGTEQRVRKVDNMDQCACRVGLHHDAAPGVHLPSCPALLSTRGCGETCNGSVEHETAPIDGEIRSFQAKAKAARVARVDGDVWRSGGDRQTQKVLRKISGNVAFLVILAVPVFMLGLMARSVADGADSLYPEDGAEKRPIRMRVSPQSPVRRMRELDPNSLLPIDHNIPGSIPSASPSLATRSLGSSPGYGSSSPVQPLTPTDVAAAAEQHRLLGQPVEEV